MQGTNQAALPVRHDTLQPQHLHMDRSFDDDCDNDLVPAPPPGCRLLCFPPSSDNLSSRGQERLRCFAMNLHPQVTLWPQSLPPP